MQAEHELIEESRHLAEFERAVALLSSVAGAQVAEKVSRSGCKVERGMWSLTSRHGTLIAEVNIHQATVLVHALPALSVRTAKVLTTRVQCTCGHPKILQGIPKHGDSYECAQCKSHVFIESR